ncbi:uncharacterized protein K452DRAFT_246766 [Aplosporella prunicola CBS 121167]|uniref:Nuclear pore complex protein n=1 Tax=Aplosporella prunicola CBS 121167 TaxID=1176127 RepID=A0A6A6BHF6_9PEZI|nr:uncharacterized protein K452DRAFT_246766 [Aplosporella prunicola CBS 121167]KAF2143570.1 hypothetical protein K452DRAFT_246766 [Aplosporella prunicola CBS 121167]
MAERVGKEVEKFAESVDNWRRDVTSNKATSITKHHSTMDLVLQLKEEAEANVGQLRKKLAAEARGAPNKRLDRIREVDEIYTSVEEEFELDFSSHNTKDALRQWQSESATWELLRMMLELNQPMPGINPAAIKKKNAASFNKLHKYSPEGDVWDRFMLVEDSAREREQILRWLEETADEARDDITTVVDTLGEKNGRGSGTWAQGWLDTKLRLKQEKRLHPWNQNSELPEVRREDTGELIASQLDPDAPTRQGRVLEQTDDNYEKSIWLAIWEMMRRGRPWHEIQEWCNERNEQWRAVSLGKAYDNHDRRTSVRGANVGGLWRRVCYAAAQAGQNEYERAVYGVMAGDISSVEPICRSWDDFLYVRLNSILLSQWDEYLQEEVPDSIRGALPARLGGPPSMLQLHGGAENANRRVVEHLAENEATKADSREPMKMIQGALISKKFERLALELGIALSKRANADGELSKLIPIVDWDNENEAYYGLAEDYDALRIVTHMLLIFRNFGFCSENDARNQQMYENIIVSYIDFLRMAGKIELVPLYASQLSHTRAYQTLGIASTDIRNFEEQKQQVVLMAEYNIDIDQVLQSQWEHTLVNSGLKSRHGDYIKRYEFLEECKHNQWPGQRIREAFLPDEITPEEEMLIRSCEWWMHLPERWHETFVALTETIKEFLLSGRLGAAVRLIERLPYRHVSKLKTADMLGIGRSMDVMEDELPTDEMANSDPDLRRSGRNPLRSSIQRPRAISPGRLQESYSLREALRAESRNYYQLQQLVQAIKMLDEWRIEEAELINIKSNGGTMPPKNKIRSLLENVCDAVNPLLNGGFLAFASDDLEAQQLHTLHLAYVPEIVLGYNTVLHSAAHMVGRDNITRCMDVATAVAAPANAALATAFADAGRLQELVRMLAASSLAMVRLSEGGGRKPDAAARKRAKAGQTMRIWDIGRGEGAAL